MNLRREAIHSEDYWEFQPGEHVMTVDGYPGVITLVEDGPMAGAENYVVTLDKGLGGGNYSASMLAKMPTGRSAAGIHLATDDYPELGTVIDDRPDPGKMIFSAALSQERQEADAEDHDEPGGDDQPHSCSYCGGTDFTDLTDNGRVRQATCGTCGGTMSAHPGMQWTPELIGDPSNHPKMTVDPRSGASPGAGAPGQAGINDFIDFDSRASTTAAKIPAATCETCHGKGITSWTDEDPDWQGDPDENPGKVHTDECDDCNGSGMSPETSDEEIAARRKSFDEQLARGTAEHVREKHPVGKLVTIDDVRGCGPRCPVGHEWDRRRKPFRYEGVVDHHTAAHAAEHGISHVYRGVHGPDAAAAADAHRAGELGSGMHGRGIYTTSSPDLATSYAQAHNGDRTGVFMHGQIHPDASVTHLDDVPKHVQLGTATDWAREQGHDVLSDGGNTHIVVNPHAVTWDPKNYDIGEAYKKFNKWGEDYHGGPEDLLGHHTAAVDGPDWCTWRRTARCTFPGDITTDGHVLGIPQDRGPCPWETRWQQQVCPISEPGPGAAMERKGSVNRTQLKIAGVPSLPERVVSSATMAALEARVASDDEDDYRMQHQAPDADYGAPLHDVTKHMHDFYEHPEYFHGGLPHDWDSTHVIRSARDQPEKMIHVYRALPGEHAHKGIRPGDWVSTSKEYARGEGRMSDSKDDYPVIRASVPAKHLHTEGDVNEWGYNGPDTVHGMVVYKGGYNQEVRHNSEGLIKQVQRRPKKEASETSGAMARLAAQMAKALGPGSANQ